MLDGRVIMAYTYEPLDMTTKQIRVITVLPGARHGGHLGSSIQCRLHIVDLDAKPYYEALSYEWGAPDQMHEIILRWTAILKCVRIYDGCCTICGTG